MKLIRSERTTFGVTLLLMAGLLSSCASKSANGGASNSGMTDRQKTTAQGAGLGALVGALAGAAIGANTGNKDWKKGALIGAAAGAIGGAAYGNHVANKKAQYAKQEDYLNACIIHSRQVNNETVNYNIALRQDIARMSQQNDQLMAQYRAGQASKKQMTAQKQLIASRRSEASQKLQTVSDEISIQTTVMEREKAPQMQSDIESLRGQKSQLESQVNDLATLDNRFSV